MIDGMSTTVAQLRETASFAGNLYRQRAGLAYYAHVRQDLLELLRTRTGREDPYRIYERIRAEGPLVRSYRGTWITTSYELIDQMLRDRRLGVRPEGDQTAPPPFGFSFLEMNPPDHTRLRRLVAPAFNPRRIATYGPVLEQSAAQLLDATSGQTFDLVSEFASALPIAAISEMLGVPSDRRGDFARFGATIGSAIERIRSLKHAHELELADAGLETLFAELLELRRSDPREDMISTIVAAEGDQVRPDEMVRMCIMLLIAGFETALNLISNMVLALFDNREQWDAICNDPTLVGAAVEETLRYDTPLQRANRFALEDIEIAGQRVRRHERVVLLLGGANRDPDAFPDPNRFDISRTRSAEHLAFGAGIHYCLGHALARLEGAAALTALVERMPTLHQAGRVVRRNSTGIRGPLRLPVSA
jgi:cytochrome P450